MSEKLTPSSFKQKLKNIPHEDIEGHFTKPLLRLFVNTQWREINEKILQEGNKSVTWLQIKLGSIKDKKGNFYLSDTPDGDFGLKTLSALVRFQRDNTLNKIDGIAGTETQDRLESVWREQNELLNPEIERRGVGLKVDVKEIEAPEIPEILKGVITSKVTRRYFEVIQGKTVFNQRAQGKNLKEILGNASGYQGTIQTGIGTFKFKYDYTVGQYVYVDGKNTGKPLQVGQGWFIKDIERMDESEVIQSKKERNRDFIERYIPQEWKKIALEFEQALNPDGTSEGQIERIGPDTPLMLVNPKTKQLACFYQNQPPVMIGVILGKNGTTTGGYQEMDGKTPVGRVHKFKAVRFSKEPESFKYPVDKLTRKDDFTQEKDGFYYGTVWDNKKQIWKRKRVTVVGCALDSDMADSFGGRYFHLVGPDRRGTLGCVGMRYEDRVQAIKFVRIIEQVLGSRGKAYGYTSVS